MNTGTLKEHMREYWHRTSGLRRREALGMSMLGQCPRRVFLDLTQPPPALDSDYRYARLGFLFEEVMKQGLGAVGVYRPGSEKSLTAPLLPDLHGHTDGETQDGDLLEIKSVKVDELHEVQRTGQVRWPKLVQVHAYMRYGGYWRALLAYVCRDTLEDAYVLVPYDPVLGEWVEARALELTQALTTGQAPSCECGWCIRRERHPG